MRLDLQDRMAKRAPSDKLATLVDKAVPGHVVSLDHRDCSVKLVNRENLVQLACRDSEVRGICLTLISLVVL